MCYKYCWVSKYNYLCYKYYYLCLKYCWVSKYTYFFFIIIESINRKNIIICRKNIIIFIIVLLGDEPITLGSYVRTQLSWVRCQDPTLLAPAAGPKSLRSWVKTQMAWVLREDPILLGPGAGPNVLGS